MKKEITVKYLFHNEYVEGVLDDGTSFYIDIEDYEKIKDLFWHDKRGYAFNNQVGLLHRYITNYPEGLEIDHVDRNRRNNRRSNIKICTRAENMKNKSDYKNNTSGHKGIKWNGSLQKWQVQITCDGKRIHLGVFKKMQDAVCARKLAEEKYKMR